MLLAHPDLATPLGTLQIARLQDEYTGRVTAVSVSPATALQIPCSREVATAGLTGEERRAWVHLLSQGVRLHSLFLAHPAHAITAGEDAVHALVHAGYSFEALLSVVECCPPSELLVSSAPHTESGVEGERRERRRYSVTMILGETADSSPLTLVCRLGDPPAGSSSWNLRITAAYQAALADEGWSGVCDHYPLCVCTPRMIRYGGADEAGAFARALSYLPSRADGAGAIWRACCQVKRGRRRSPTSGYHAAVFPRAGRCEHDGRQLLQVAARVPLSFIVGREREFVEVEGVPALACPGCGARTLDVALLARIEAHLGARVEEGECRPTYYFKLLAYDLGWLSSSWESARSVPLAS